MKYNFLILVLIVILGISPAKAEEKQNCDVIIYGQCTDCNTANSFEISTKETCQAFCPNREVFHNYHHTYCALKNCPPEYPVKDQFTGSCRSNSPTSEDSDFDKDHKEMDIAIKEFSVKTTDGKCPPDNPVLYNKNCFSCDYPFNLFAEKQYLGLCSNRIEIPYPWDMDGEYTETYLPCPPDKPLLSWNGKCMSCDYPKTVRVLTQCLEDDTVCNVCPNRIILPQDGGNRPSILKCPADRPLMDETGICFSCDLNVPVKILNQNDCEQLCPQHRKLLNGLCEYQK